MTFQVAGLARRVHDSSNLQLKFENLVGEESQMRALVRRIVTRWNTDFDSLRSHIILKRAVNMLFLYDPSLKKYQLDEEQWDLAHALVDQLQVCTKTQLAIITLTPKTRFLRKYQSAFHKQRFLSSTRFSP